MTWENKPVWIEGMFLRPQHFQQFDRFVGAQLEARVAPLSSFGWGIAELVLDEGLLKTGRIAITRVSGVFPDGTPFRVPEETAAPLALEVSKGLRDSTVCLCIPLARAGAAEVALDAAARAETRFLAEEFEAADTIYGAAARVPLNVGRLQLTLRPEAEGLAGYATIPIARVVERRSDDSISLDAGFIPSALAATATPVLSGFITELEGLAHQRGEAIAGRLGTPGGKAVADITDFLFLTVLNRFEATIKHFAALPVLHPVELYRTLCELAGELATFTAPGNRPTFMPVYSHRDLRVCFDAVMLELRNTFNKVFEQNAVAIPLVMGQYGIRVGQISDHTLFTDSTFVFAVRAAVDTEKLRANMPRLTKIGSPEHIRDLVMRQLPGADIFPMAAEPRQLPYRANTVYFGINDRSAEWQAVRTAGALAMHIASNIPELELEVWAIRGGQR